MSSGVTRRTTRTPIRRTQRGGGSKLGGGGAAFKAAFAIIIFMAILFGVWFLKMDSDRRKALAEANAKVEVVGAIQDLPKGTKLTAENIKMVQIPKSTDSPSLYKDVNDPSLIGATLNIDVLTDQPIYSSYLGKEGVVSNERLAANSGEIEVKAELDPSDAQQPFMSSGNKVTVYSLLKTPAGNRITKLISKNARILSITAPEVDKNLVGQEVQKVTGEIILALNSKEAEIFNQEIFDSKSIRFLQVGQNPPPSNASIIQVWTGVDSQEKEVPASIGSTIINTESEEKQEGGKG